MYFVATTNTPQASPRFYDADSHAKAVELAHESMRMMSLGSIGTWVEIEPELWVWRMPDGSSRFDAMYVEIGQDA